MSDAVDETPIPSAQHVDRAEGAEAVVAAIGKHKKRDPSPTSGDDRNERRRYDKQHHRRHSSRSRSRDRNEGRGDRGGVRDRSRSYDRSRRNHYRDRDRDNRYNRDRDRDRNGRDRDSGRERERGRDRDRDRRSRDRNRDSRERSPPVDREELRKQREIDDLTKDQRTIFVSQLTKKTGEQSLEDFFGAVGKVKNIIMLRDKATGHHKGFAYVEMAELESIPNCLLFNNVVPDFQKFPILVKASEAEKNFLAKKDPFSSSYEPPPATSTAATATGAGGAGGGASSLAPVPLLAPGMDATGRDARVYVGNIHVSITDDTLKQVMEQFGAVESLKLHRDHLGNSKGFAFIKYVSADSAQLAMASLGGQELMGRILKVGPVIDQHTKPAAPAATTATEATSSSSGVFQLAADGGGGGGTGNWKLDADEGGGGGLSLNATSRMALIAKLGATAGIEVPAPPPPLPTTTAAAAAAAAAAMGAVQLQGQVQQVQQQGPPPIGGTPSPCLLICNMFDPATETDPEWDLDIKEDMLEECAKFGQVETVYVEKVKPGGMVLLKFNLTETAVKAAQAMNGRFFAGRMITATYLEDDMFASLVQ